MADGSPAHNPALADLAPLIGDWRVTVSNASFLSEGSTLSGTTSFSWLDDALIVMRSEFPEGGPPRSTSVIGRNESLDTYSMLYYDARGVSRTYTMGFDVDTWMLLRQDPDFYQRFVGRLDGDTISAEWQISTDAGVTWEHDFDLTYERLP